ncbi:MAG TPA: hypothetical protein VLH77_01195 [Gammaproteobacteria bacterium]|nr:hypothetical protein [Gammaproteobacteria bacterium]
MSVTKAGMPVADQHLESYEDLFLRTLESTKPRIDTSEPVTPEGRMRMVAAAMQQRVSRDLSRLYVDRLRSEDSYQDQIRRKDDKINELEEKLEGSEKNVEKLMAELRIQKNQLELAQEEVARLKAASPSGK